MSRSPDSPSELPCELIVDPPSKVPGRNAKERRHRHDRRDGARLRLRHTIRGLQPESERGQAAAPALRRLPQFRSPSL